MRGVIGMTTDSFFDFGLEKLRERKKAASGGRLWVRL